MPTNINSVKGNTKPVNSLTEPAEMGCGSDEDPT
ncbi:hypothetical protein H1R20_g13956, partial [Candolleomyces eurysporus]